MLEQNQYLSWDVELSSSVSGPWLEMIAEAVQSGSIYFPRCTRPDQAIGNPSVVVFTDEAAPAFATAVYLHWQVPSKPDENKLIFLAKFLFAKSKVTPPSGYTIPRIELSVCVLGSRLGLSTVKALQTEDGLYPTVVYV